MAEELVLSFPRSILDELGSFQGICLQAGRYLDHILDARNSRFLPRTEAEHDPRFKQIIPYILIRRKGRWLHYVRGKKSGEKRLVAKGSIGIGGHINLGDENLFVVGREFYDAAVERELHEELRLSQTPATHAVALLNDDSTPVGQVHLGVVHVCDLGDGEVSKREAQITELQFLTRTELETRRAQLESWSQFCLDHLDQLEKALPVV
ncbi:MAG: hypothetical protein AB1898_11940 [Acidobacteriota bacterium]